MKKIISVSISEEIVNKIDNERGLVPRSAVIEERLKGSMGCDHTPITKEGVRTI